ncbi:MAG: M14 family zinc carboxypeptidase [Balneolales bacterium]
MPINFRFRPFLLIFISVAAVLLLPGMAKISTGDDVADELSRLHLSVDELIMQPGQRQELQFRAELSDGRLLELSDLNKEQVRVVSLNPDVATVGSAGQIFARNTGAATIQVQVTFGETTQTGQIRIGVPERPLSEHDFVLDGPYGGYESAIEQVGENHFIFRRGQHPIDESRSSLPQFMIPANFKGNPLTVDIHGLSLPSTGHNYHMAYSFDGRNWTPIRQRQVADNVSRIEIPPSNSDSFYFGFQIPLSHDTAERFMKQWAAGLETADYLTVHSIGRSVQGRPLYRMEITDAGSPHKYEDRWVHYISQAHPHEGKSRWRVKGMIDWLLSDAPEAAEARRRHIWHFVLVMNPDGVNNGFTRVNLEGVDMNRTYHVSGSDSTKQAWEGYVYQRDIERLMASDTPLTTFWDMHVWGRRVEPMMHPGPEFGNGDGQLGDWTELRRMMEGYDDHDLIKPLETRSYDGGTTVWDRGVHHQFGITSSLVEGGGYLDTQEENMQAGSILIRSISEFYRGTRTNSNP